MKRLSVSYYAVVAAILVVYTLALLPFPRCLDNYQLEAVWLGANGGVFNISWADFCRYFSEISIVDNVRLAQLFSPILTLAGVSPLVGAVALASCVAIIYIVASRFVSGRHCDIWALSLVWLGATLALPWRNWLLGQLYCMNYIPGSAFALLGLALWNEHKDLSRLVLALLFFVLAAFGHEAIGASLLCGLIAWCALGFRQIRWVDYVAVLLYACCVVWIFSLGGTSGRVGAELERRIGWDSAVSFCIIHYMVIALLAFMGGILFWKRGRRALTGLLADSRFVILTVSAVAFMCANALTMCQTRQGFWPQLASLIAAIMLLRRLWPAVFSTPRPFVNVFLTSALIVFWGFVAAVQFTLGREYAVMESAMIESHTKEVRLDLPHLSRSYPLLLGIPMRKLINYHFQTACMQHRYPDMPADIIVVDEDGVPYPSSY